MSLLDLSIVDWATISNARAAVRTLALADRPARLSEKDGALMATSSAVGEDRQHPQWSHLIVARRHDQPGAAECDVGEPDGQRSDEGGAVVDERGQGGGVGGSE
jgi:hypothetical protein